ncbi:MAG: DUF4249 domain-containing protein [Bacteroidetes bacterium]|nr:DUF4249 domain-containing protein [Bacteroidota bacterium]
MKISKLIYGAAAMIIVLALAACQKVISLDLRNQSGQLVVEANITNVQGAQYVTLSRNVPFTSQNVYPPVTGATVSLKDNAGNIFPFTEGPAGTYSMPNLQGVTGNTYYLSVTTGGKTYNAQSTMPAAVALDSITAHDDLFEASKGKKRITVHFQDPPNVANQYRFVEYVNHKQVKSVYAFDDQFINGKYVSLDLEQNDINIYARDTVTVEMQCIDKPVYTYWYTLMQQQQDNPGGQVAPSNPTTNITPATLGYFSAHTKQVKTLVVQ